MTIRCGLDDTLHTALRTMLQSGHLNSAFSIQLRSLLCYSCLICAPLLIIHYATTVRTTDVI